MMKLKFTMTVYSLMGTLATPIEAKKITGQALKYSYLSKGLIVFGTLFAVLSLISFFALRVPNAVFVLTGYGRRKELRRMEKGLRKEKDEVISKYQKEKNTDMIVDNERVTVPCKVVYHDKDKALVKRDEEKQAIFYEEDNSERKTVAFCADHNADHKKGDSQTLVLTGSQEELYNFR